MKISKKLMQSVQKNAKKTTEVLKLLANEKRLTILYYMLDKERSSGNLADLVNLSSSAISQHLKKMHKSGLLTSRKCAQEVFYSIASEEINVILSTLYLIYCH